MSQRFLVSPPPAKDTPKDTEAQAEGGETPISFTHFTQGIILTESPIGPLKQKIHIYFEDHRLMAECVAEFWGSFLFIFSGIAGVSSAAIIPALKGLWQLTVVWGFGLTLAIYAVAPISGGHLNPAVSFAFALLRPTTFPMYKLGPYIFAQLCGGILAGAINLAFFAGAISSFEANNNIVRGELGSERSAMCFGEYFPNPAILPGEANYPICGMACAFFVEAFGTAVLMFMILALTSPMQSKGIFNSGAPFFIGFTVALMMSLLTPLDQGGFNPARDFGPRIIAAMAGWGKIAIPGPRGGFWVYIVGPMVGAPIGGAIRDLFIEPAWQE